MRTRYLTATLGAMGLAGAIALGNSSAVAQADPDPVLFAELMEEGQDVFLDNCAFCHGDEGQGAGAPKLAGNAYISANASTVTLILDGYGSHGMPAFRTALSVREVAAVTTFVRNSWGNSYGMTTEAIVLQYYNDGGGSL